MHFIYTAKKMNGQEIKGVLEAKDKFELARLLRQQGFIVVSCEAEKEGKKNFSLPDVAIFNRVSLSEKIFFCRNLSVMISAGVSLSRGLDILCRQTKNKFFKKILGEISEKIKKGNSLSESVKEYPKIFPMFFAAMVKVGEESGRLSESLMLVSEQLEKDSAIRKKVKGAMVYPAIILIAMSIIGILMLIYVVPTLVSTFEELGVELPFSTKIVIAASGFLLHKPLLAALVFLPIILSIGWLTRSQKGKILLGNVFLRLPFFSSLIKKINSARTTRTLSSLISAGVDVLEALNIARDMVQNEKFKNVLAQARIDIQKGVPISESFKNHSDLYPILVGEMMAVGEETGKLSDMLLRLAMFYEDEVSEATKNLSTIVEPVLMIIIGAIVGFFAISMIKPMYSMMSGI